MIVSQEMSMTAELSPADTDKLIELQEQCDTCKEAIIHESNVELRLEMQKVCDKCRKVRLRVPELMELKQKLHAFNAEQDANV
jgi:hypothetical protein